VREGGGPTDARLVARVLAGEHEAFDLLVGRYGRSAMAAALSRLADRHEAEDAVQEAFLAAYRSLGRLRERERFAPWLLTIVRRLAADRALKRRPEPVEELPEPTDGPEERDGNMRRQEVLAEVDRLPESYRRVVLLRHGDGLSCARIAEVCGSPVGTITSRLARAYEMLREKLKER